MLPTPEDMARDLSRDYAYINMRGNVRSDCVNPWSAALRRAMEAEAQIASLRSSQEVSNRLFAGLSQDCQRLMAEVERLRRIIEHRCPKCGGKMATKVNSAVGQVDECVSCGYGEIS